MADTAPLRLSDIKPGDRLRTASNCGGCFTEGQELTVEADADGDLFVRCHFGQHYLDSHFKREKAEVHGFSLITGPTGPNPGYGNHG